MNKMNNKISVIIMAAGKGQRIWPYNYKGKMVNTICGVNLVEKAVNNVKCISKDIHIIYDDLNAPSINNLIHVSNIKLHRINCISAPQSIRELLKKTSLNKIIMLYEASSYLINENLINEMVHKFNKNEKLSILIKKENDEQNLMKSISFNSKTKKIFLNPRASYVDSKIAGIFLFNKHYLEYFIHSNSNYENLSVGNPPSNEELISNVINKIIVKEKTINIVVNNEWLDIKWPWDIANAFFLTMTNKSYISKKAIIEKGARVGQNVYIEDGAFIDSISTVGNNCYIGKNAQIKDGGLIRDFSHIGANTKIGFNADIEGFIMESVSIVHYCEINSMIGRGTEIGAGTFVGALKFDNKNPLFKVKKMKFTDKTVYPCFIGNHTRTGVGTITLPGVIIGNECAIYPGAIVRENIEDNSLLIVESKNRQKKGKWSFNFYGGN